MALVKVDTTKKVVSWNSRDQKATRHRLPSGVKKPVLDYGKIKELCKIDGLGHPKSVNTSSKDAHKKFMEAYTDVFVPEEPKRGLPIHSLKRSEQKSSEGSLDSKSVAGQTPSEDLKSQAPAKSERKQPSHNISEHLSRLHKQRISENPAAQRKERIKTLRRLLKKLSFERTAAENDIICEALGHFPAVADQVSDRVLKELCVVAQLDTWKEADMTLFGNTGLHMILRGSVKPQSDPCTKSLDDGVEFPCPTPQPPEDVKPLRSGACFGTLVKIKGREANSRILTVSTLEPNCEFLKISCSDYLRVIEQMKQRDQTEKVNLLQTCKTYKYWSKQPLLKVADLIEWVSFSPNTVLVSEGYKAPFVAVIKSGECHVLRQVDILQTLPNGKKERNVKQVVMGKLGLCESFGEISVIADEPITCSIVTASDVELAVVDPKKLSELDETTLQLLLHSSEKTFGNLSKQDIYDEYVQQEMKREWNEFKHSCVVEVINSCGIRPGYGKWAKK